MTSPDPLAALVGKWRELLDVAVCPNASNGCDGEQYPDYDGHGDVVGVQCQWCYERRACADELATALDASRVGVPEGFVLVPREPTPEMICATFRAPDAPTMWKRMLSAAPGADAGEVK